MSGSWKKLAPTAIVLLFACWCCYPHFSASAPLIASQQPDSQTIPQSLLEPEVGPPCERDPFQPAAKPRPPVAAASDPPPPAATPPAAAPVATTAPEAPPPDPGQILEHLTLQATYIHDDRRVAMINNQVYAEGDEIHVSASTPLTCTVLQVRSDRVLLDSRGEEVELTYTAPPSRAPAPDLKTGAARHGKATDQLAHVSKNES